MHKAPLIGDGAIAPDEDVICYCLPKHLDFEDIRDDLFCFTIDIRVNKGHVVVTCDHVSESG